MNKADRPKRPDTRRAHKLLHEAARRGVHSEADIVAGFPEHLATSAMLREASANLEIDDPPALGTGNEAIPSGDRAAALPGLVETLKDPTHVNMNASEDRADLLSRAGAWDIGLDMAEGISATDPMTKALAHQMGALHVKAMELFSRAEELLRQADVTRRLDHKTTITSVATKLLNSAERLLGRYQQGMTALHRVRHGNRQTVSVVHQHVSVDAKNVAMTSPINVGGSEHEPRSRK